MNFFDIFSSTYDNNVKIFFLCMVFAVVATYLLVKVYKYIKFFKKYNEWEREKVKKYLKCLREAVNGDYGDYWINGPTNAGNVAEKLGMLGIIEALPGLEQIASRQGSLIVRNANFYRQITEEHDLGDYIRKAATRAVASIKEQNNLIFLIFFRLRFVAYFFIWIVFFTLFLIAAN